MGERMGEREGEKTGSVRRRWAVGQPGGADCRWAVGEGGEERTSERGGWASGTDGLLIPSPGGHTDMASLSGC